MKLLRQDIRHPTLSLSTLGMELELLYPSSLIHSAAFNLFPYGQPNDGLDIGVEAKPLTGTNLVCLWSISQHRFIKQ